MSHVALLWAATFGLIVTRVAGFVVVSPFPGNNVTPTARVGLCVVLAWVVSAYAPLDHVPHDLAPALVGAAAGELACGLLVGAAFRFVLAAGDVLGEVVAQACGLSMPSVLNPSTETQDASLARIFSLLSLLIALGAGIHRVAIGYLLASFRALPIGRAMDVSATAEGLVDWGGEALAVGVRLAMPVLAVGLVVQIALAMIARAAPSLQLFSVGLSVLLVTGLLTTIAAAGDMSTALAAHLSTLGPRLDSLFVALHGASP